GGRKRRPYRPGCIEARGRRRLVRPRRWWAVPLGGLLSVGVGCGVLDCGEFVGGGPFVSSLDPVRAGVVLGLERRDRGRGRLVGEWLHGERCELPLSERERHGYGLVDVGGVRDAYPAHCLARPCHGRVVVDGEPPPRIVGATRPP